MVEVERKDKKIVPTTRIISVFILAISMVVLAFSTNKIYEYHELTQKRDELVERKEQLIRENEEELFSFIPELGLCKGFNQNNKWHIYDVYEHILHVVSGVDKNKCVRIAAFFIKTVFFIFSPKVYL